MEKNSWSFAISQKCQLTILLSKISGASVSWFRRTIRSRWRLASSSAKLTQKRNLDAVSDLESPKKFGDCCQARVELCVFSVKL